MDYNPPAVQWLVHVCSIFCGVRDEVDANFKRIEKPSGEGWVGTDEDVGPGSQVCHGAPNRRLIDYHCVFQIAVGRDLSDRRFFKIQPLVD